KSLTFVRDNLLLFRTRKLVKKLFKLFKRLLCKRNALFRWKRFGAHDNSHRDSRISPSSFLKTKEALVLQSAASGVQADGVRCPSVAGKKAYPSSRLAAGWSTQAIAAEAGFLCSSPVLPARKSQDHRYGVQLPGGSPMVSLPM